jgi:hypothetical protein
MVRAMVNIVSAAPMARPTHAVNGALRRLAPFP